MTTTGVDTCPAVRRPPRDPRRVLQLALATIWLIDGVLQLQPFMFTAGSTGFSGMLASTAPGNPGVVARSINWNASVVNHHAVLTDCAFALIQILIGLGIAWRPAVKPVLAISVVWSLGVWWFGEGLGGVLHGRGTPIGGGPGAVLFYGLLAVLLWPADRADGSAPWIAARFVGTSASRVIWVVTWASMALLALLGSGRSPQGIQGVVQTVDVGQPGWLNTLDAHAISAVDHRGLTVAVIFAVICLVVAAGVYLDPAVARGTLVLAMVTAVVVWVVGENFGMILAGGATDPNSGPLLALLAVAYWPLHRGHAPAGETAAERTVAASPVGAV